jgi:hypothetical protein
MRGRYMKPALHPFIEDVESVHKKRPVYTGLPLRLIRHIVIWEGNYTSDI